MQCSNDGLWDLSMTPLSGITVIDLSRFRSGPTAVRQLADWGADVIMVEPPAGEEEDTYGGRRSGPDFQNLHRNKRSLTLNLKSGLGVEILKRIAATADVLVENFRPDVKTRLGIDYAALREVNKRIVYASISGFGQDGPYRDRPGFDQIAQGMGGLMSITGLPGQGPVRVGIPIADLSAGIFCAQGILLALLERERSGEGQWVNTSLLEAQIFMLDFQASTWLNLRKVPRQAGNNHPTSIPTGVFKTADGFINVAASGQKIWERLCDVVGASELRDRPVFATEQVRSENRDALHEELEKKLLAADSATWIGRLNDAGVPCGPIYSIDEVFADPQVQHLNMVASVASPHYNPLRLVSQPLHLSASSSDVRMRPPERGEHTQEILGSLGCSSEEIASLRRTGAI
jgi:crotonobetainyl-CoA:carnitine CoA-transferase CaiB-like acyl-CoA transferase